MNEAARKVKLVPETKRPLEFYIEHADELAQNVVNHWGASFDAQEKLPADFKDLLDKTFPFRDAKSLADNHRQFNMLTPEDEAKEKETRVAFAEAFKARKDSLVNPTDRYECARCNLIIGRDDGKLGFRFTKPTYVVPMILQDFKTLQRSFETRLCPLCGFEMISEQAGSQ